MIRSERRLRLSAWMTALLLCFIWGNSLLPGEASEWLSNGLRDILARLLPGEVPGVTSGGGLLRKMAHFTEFAALGGALCWRFGMLKKKKILALAYGFGTACVDETIQLFVPDRGPSLRDVGIDTLGVAAGIGLLLTAHHIIRKMKTIKGDKPL